MKSTDLIVSLELKRYYYLHSGCDRLEKMQPDTQQRAGNDEHQGGKDKYCAQFCAFCVQIKFGHVLLDLVCGAGQSERLDRN